MNRHIMIIMNPKAGKRNASSCLFTICDRFNAMNDTTTVFVTQYAGQAKNLSFAYASQYDILVCIGGDGTWNEVVSGLMRIPSSSRPNLCYLPSGTVNDFAASLKLSKNPSKLMDTVLQETHFQCDIGKFNKRFFTYVAAFGIFTEVSYSTPQNSKNTFGKVAYFLEGIKQITKITSYHVRVEADAQVMEDNVIFGCITNSKYVAGFTSVNYKDIALDDGMFEMLLIRMPNNLLDVQNIVTALLKHEINDKWMYFCKCSHVHITALKPIPWTLDGEDGKSTMECTIANLHRAITLLV